jgi:phosphohistidine phosphatase
MQLLFVRHAPAGDRAKYAKTGRPDAERPLTPAGIRKMKKAARGLKRILSTLDLVATSPLKRARQTAHIVADAFSAVKIAEFEELSPSREPKELAARLRSLKGARVVALVGHEPHLSSAVAHMISGGSKLRLELKKGACCLVGFDRTPEAGAGTLLWSLAPAHLRKLS